MPSKREKSKNKVPWVLYKLTNLEGRAAALSLLLSLLALTELQDTSVDVPEELTPASKAVYVRTDPRMAGKRIPNC